MVCKVNDCGRIRRDLTKHIKTVHAMTINEYKKLYNENVIDDEIIQQRENKKDLNSKGDFYCPVCKKYVKNEREFKRHCRREGASHNQLLYPDDKPDSWVECKLCANPTRQSRIDLHIQKEHKISKEEYEEKYGSTLSNNFIKTSIKNRNARNNGN